MNNFAFEHEPLLDLSIVLPVYNEQDNLNQLFDELVTVLDPLGLQWEILAVDDGSSDGSLEVLRTVVDAYPDATIRVVELTRNFGQTAALSCGFDLVQGRVVIPMDTDLQNDPTDIPRLLEGIEAGADVVSGWRRNRKDHPLRTFPSKVANCLINKLIKSTGVSLHDYGCTLKAYRREVLDGLQLYGEMHRFIPAFAGWRGARVSEIEVNHRARTAGESKYGMGRIWKVVMDLIAIRFFTDHLTKPMQFFGKYAMYLSGAMIMALALLGGADLAGATEITFNTYLLTAMAFLLAVQNLLGIGIVAEIIVRHYFEAGDKRPYAIRTIQSRADRE